MQGALVLSSRMHQRPLGLSRVVVALHACMHATPKLHAPLHATVGGKPSDLAAALSLLLQLLFLSSLYAAAAVAAAAASAAAPVGSCGANEERRFLCYCML